MAIRIPANPWLGVSEIRQRGSEKVFTISKVVKTDEFHNLLLIWENTNFLDANGKPFYDVNGQPFLGKKE